MIEFNNERTDDETSWQSTFVAMLPEIHQRLRSAFYRLDPASREESTAEAVAHCLVSYFRLHERGSAEVATASTLAWFAALAVKRGRPAASRMNGKELLSRYAQFGNGIRVQRQPSSWLDQLIEDERASVPDLVALRLDFGAWFATLSRGMKTIARDLAYGHSTSEVAKKHGVTPGRISQLRRSLEVSWAAFQQEAPPDLAQ